MICVDQNGQAVEISVADQMWLDDSYFKEKQLRLGTDAPRVALAYRVSTKGQVDHDDIPMQKIDCRKFAQKQGWRVVKEVAEKGVSGSKVSASKRDAIQQLKEEAANGELNSTPFVRQYGILSNKWGVLLCKSGCTPEMCIRFFQYSTVLLSVGQL